MSESSGVSSKLSTCLKWMRPAHIQPPCQMFDGEALMSPAASHEAWRKQLINQGAWPHHYNHDYPAKVEASVRDMMINARLHNGAGPLDLPFSRDDWEKAVAGLKNSSSVAPDLICRYINTTDNPSWIDASWLLQRLCGPGLLCYRPALWRYRRLAVKHKKGNVSLVNSYRFLGVTQLQGLLRERLLIDRIAPNLHKAVDYVQTGYRFDVAHHHYTLFEVQTSYVHYNRTLFKLFADQVHAFPRTWRAVLLTEAADAGELRDGCLALLGSIMSSDMFVVPMSGFSCVKLVEGLPE